MQPHTRCRFGPASLVSLKQQSEVVSFLTSNAEYQQQTLRQQSVVHMCWKKGIAAWPNAQTGRAAEELSRNIVLPPAWSARGWAKTFGHDGGTKPQALKNSRLKWPKILVVVGTYA